MVVPLKDAMRLSEYKEHDRNYKFYVRKKVNGKQLTLRSYSFVLKGILKHEMYLKPLHPAYIKSFLGKDYRYKVVITPNKPIDLEYDSRNRRRIEIIIYSK